MQAFPASKKTKLLHGLKIAAKDMPVLIREPGFKTRFICVTSQSKCLVCNLETFPNLAVVC